MSNAWVSSESTEPFDPSRIARPDPVLLWYYILISLLTGPFAPLAVLPLLCKYYTLRYRFDQSGVSVAWGVLWRREVYLTYRRIQDIHLTRNLVQRWMGLATVAIQTAAGSARPEMSIEGIVAVEPLRDYLYAQMRGARGELEIPGRSELDAGEHAGLPADTDAVADEALVLLREIRDDLRSLAPPKDRAS